MNQSGLTLLELMVVLAVSAILLGIGIPSFASFTTNTRLANATNELVASLHLARSEAIKRSSRAVMCPSATGDACTESGGWHQGWLVFHDANDNAILDADEAVILSRPALPTGIRVTSKDSTARYISYAPTGGTKQTTGAFQAGTLTVCSDSGSSNAVRKVIISRTGRPRVVKLTLSDCP